MIVYEGKKGGEEKVNYDDLYNCFFDDLLQKLGFLFSFRKTAMGGYDSPFQIPEKA